LVLLKIPACDLRDSVGGDYSDLATGFWYFGVGSCDVGGLNYWYLGCDDSFLDFCDDVLCVIGADS